MDGWMQLAPTILYTVLLRASKGGQYKLGLVVEEDCVGDLGDFGWLGEIGELGGLAR
jgi:hypothetical protein